MMKRRNFFREGGLCCATLALFNSREVIAADDTPEVKRLKEQKNYFLNKHAVMFDILSEELDPEDFKQVYLRFGETCAIQWGSVDKAKPYSGKLEAYLKDLPALDKWQEKAWYNEEKKEITIIGIKRDQCVCSMARNSNDPDWCNCCCAGHQKAIFETLLGKEVEVTMGETLLNGGERCNHFVRILDKDS